MSTKINTRSPFYKQYSGTVTIDSEEGEEIDGVTEVAAIRVDSTQDRHKVSNNYIILTDANT